MFWYFAALWLHSDPYHFFIFFLFFIYHSIYFSSFDIKLMWSLCERTMITLKVWSTFIYQGCILVWLLSIKSNFDVCSMILIGIGAKSGDPVKELHYLQWDVQSCFMFHTYMLSSTKLIPPYNPVRYLMIINWKQQNSFPIVCNPASLMECDAHWFPWCYFKTQEFYPVVIS